MILNILNCIVKKKCMIKNKIFIYVIKILKKNYEFIYFIFMIKVRYVCLLKCFLNILK